jgi:hypothetical protein
MGWATDGAGELRPVAVPGEDRNRMSMGWATDGAGELRPVAVPGEDRNSSTSLIQWSTNLAAPGRRTGRGSQRRILRQVGIVVDIELRPVAVPGEDRNRFGGHSTRPTRTLRPVAVPGEDRNVVPRVPALGVIRLRPVAVPGEDRNTDPLKIVGNAVNDAAPGRRTGRGSQRQPGPAGQAARDRGRAYRHLVTGALTRALRGAAARGEISPDAVEAKARVLTATVMGVLLTARVDTAEAAAVADATADEVTGWRLRAGRRARTRSGPGRP